MANGYLISGSNFRRYDACESPGHRCASRQKQIINDLWVHSTNTDCLALARLKVVKSVANYDPHPSLGASGLSRGSGEAPGRGELLSFPCAYSVCVIVFPSEKSWMSSPISVNAVFSPWFFTPILPCLAGTLSPAPMDHSQPPPASRIDRLTVTDTDQPISLECYERSGGLLV